jgi:hypothetical protein
MREAIHSFNDKIQTFISSNTLFIAFIENYYIQYYKFSINEKLYHF